MPSYRFCRPDDIPFLVRAINECYGVHFPAEPEMTVERFRDEMRDFGVWPSNSMVAIAGKDPVAVMIGAKHQDEVRIMRAGAHPEHQRQGHCSHLLTSLSHKLAVLGPPRLVAEVPESMPAGAALLESVGYRRERTFQDWLREPAETEPVPEGWVMPVTVTELVDNGALATPEGAPWDRHRESLIAGEESLEGVAVASPERIEAYLLFRQEAGRIDIFGSHVVSAERRELFLGVLVRYLAGRFPEETFRLPCLTEAEIESGWPAALSFKAGEQVELYGAVAEPA